MNGEPWLPSQEPTDRVAGDEMLDGVSTVIARCKNDGVMLSARENRDSGQYELVSEPVKPYDRFKAPVRLWRASTRHGISYVVLEARISGIPAVVNTAEHNRRYPTPDPLKLAGIEDLLLDLLHNRRYPTPDPLKRPHNVDTHAG